MKKKILFINGHLNTGGVEKSLLDILTHFDYEKYEVDLLLVEQLGDYATQVPDPVNIIYKSIENTHGPFFKVIKECVKRKDWFCLKMRLVFLLMKFFGQKYVSLAKKMLTNGKQYDCVIGFRAGFCSQIAAYAVNANKRITWWHHGEINVDHNLYLEISAIFDHIVVVSEYCNRLLSDSFPTIKRKIVTIHNIVDVEAIKHKANAFIPNYEENILHIVSVGRLVPDKHFDNAIYAAKQLKEAGLEFIWHLIGDGALREAYEIKVKELGITNCFNFEGNKVNPYPYIKNADLFVHPSYVESFGLVVAEALALGIPCVVTKTEGVQEFLIDRENSLLTEKSHLDLTEKVHSILMNNELMEKIKGNSKCSDNVRPINIINKIENLINHM